MRDRLDFLPVTIADVKARNWSDVDFVYVSGDAYVDHPSFGASIITRVLEKEGFRIAILSQPDYKSCESFRCSADQDWVSLFQAEISTQWLRITPCRKKDAPTIITVPEARWEGVRTEPS